MIQFFLNNEYELKDFLYGFTCMVKPFKALEIGTFEGASSIAIAKALEANKQGMLWTYDIADFDQKKFIAKAGLTERVICTIDDAKNILTKLSINAGTEGMFEMAFIDDGHSFEDATRDLNICHKLVTKFGYILGHDIHSTPSVNDAYEAFLGKYGHLYERLVVASYCGLFILKRIA